MASRQVTKKTATRIDPEKKAVPAHIRPDNTRQVVMRKEGGLFSIRFIPIAGNIEMTSSVKLARLFSIPETINDDAIKTRDETLVSRVNM